MFCGDIRPAQVEINLTAEPVKEVGSRTYRDLELKYLVQPQRLRLQRHVLIAKCLKKCLVSVVAFDQTCPAPKESLGFLGLKKATINGT